MENIQADFSINEWFNELPIRIVGSHEEPFFYANDLATILGIAKVRNSVKNFTEKDIVTPEQREKYGIKTYRIVRGKMVEEQSIILLTEYGAYRLIMRSNSDKAEELRNFIIDSIRRLRITENLKLKTVNEKLIAECNDLKQKSEYAKDVADKLQRLEMYDNMMKVVHVFSIECDGDPYKFLEKNERDTYFMEEYQQNITNYNGKLFKYTSQPTPNDYSRYKLSHEIHLPRTVEFFDMLFNYEHAELTMSEKVYNYSRYLQGVSPKDIEEDIEELHGKVVSK